MSDRPPTSCPPTAANRLPAGLRGAMTRAADWLFRRSSAWLSRRGYVLLRRHYYLPIPEVAELAHEQDSELVGVPIDTSHAFEILDTAVLPYRPEFARFPVDAPATDEPYYLLNGRFMAGDGDVYYGLIRHLKPRRIVEVGSGFSTLLAARAIERNVQEGGPRTELTCVEPFPGVELRRAATRDLRLIVEPVQRVPLELFASLGPGDILFIDSTHVLKSGGDVWYEYCEVLPRLRPGVWVHVHDVSLPAPYPRAYFENALYWNEQYLLQAFLTFNSRVEVLWAGSWMMARHPQPLAAAFSPGYAAMKARFPQSAPTSFWFRMK